MFRRQVVKSSFALAVLLLLVACPPAARPVISEPTPDPLELGAEVNQTDTGSVSFNNTGDAPLNYTASEDAGWLEVTSGASGTVQPGGSATVELSAACPAQPAELTAALSISSNGGNKTVSVTLSCEGEADISEPTPDPLELAALVNEGTTGTVTFQNTGNIDLSYSASASESWLEITSGDSGTVSPGNTATLELSASCPATPGDLSGSLSIDSNDPDEASKTITVNLSCEDPEPEISEPTPNPLELAAEVNETDTGSVSFDNTGDAPLNYTASESESWLEVTSGASGSVQPGGSATVELSATCPGTPDTLSGTLTIDSDDPDEPNKTVTVNLSCTEPAVSDFDIELRFNGADFNAAREQVFEDAAARWAEIITGDEPDTMIDKPEDDCGAGDPALDTAVDDLFIDAFIEPIDGEGGILGSAGPCYIRTSGDQLPIYGVMRFDSADIAALEADGTFDLVILHEMGHVLGVGSYWDFFGYLDYATDPGGQSCNQATVFTTSPTFNGTEANGEFAALGESGQAPVEDEFGPGTQCSHWDEAFFNTELMTGFLGPGNDNPLSRLTGASLADLGYEVDLTTADPYSVPGCSPSCLQAAGEARQIQEIVLPPKFAVAEDGSVTRLEPRARD